MDYKRGIPRLLHDEHRATIELLEQARGPARPRWPWRSRSRPAGDAKVLTELGKMIEDEVRRHFAFEEAELFTRLAAMGDGAIGEHLTEEHQTILPVGERVGVLAAQAAMDGMNETDWEEFRALGAELIERMLAHIQKEEMALLPMLEDTLDPSEDLTLVSQYGSGS